MKIGVRTSAFRTAGDCGGGASISPAQIDFWHIASLTILCLGTLIFGVLFVSTMQRQGSMWFETRHGGLAGNIGGWRISASVGYLAGALLFGALFGAMVMTDSGPDSHGAANRAPLVPSAPG
jgi:hypothetical protein